MFTDRLVISYSTMVTWGELNRRPSDNDFFRKAKLSDEARSNVTPTDIAFSGCPMRVRSVNRYYRMTALGHDRFRRSFCMVDILNCRQT